MQGVTIETSEVEQNADRVGRGRLYSLSVWLAFHSLAKGGYSKVDSLFEIRDEGDCGPSYPETHCRSCESIAQVAENQ
ncbi:hypothetical protein CBOM_07522 [Ceraceosorus bombacis]|uniref:Uncharacterized protein n=1 Tax=Ceraceosorus bombacis TaxID=401625 RepID=A0A0P1BED5_9BASI|nr:hypothetical protein CBOM_07522 [Ceraceosorus bombacis]